MLGYKFKIENVNTGQFFYINDHVTDPDKFIALQEYPAFDVDIKNAEVPKEGQHGIFDFYSFYGKRVINFSGVIVGLTEADVEDLKKTMLQVVSLPPIPAAGDDGSVMISWTDANGDDWQIAAKLQGYPRFSRDMKQGSRLYFSLVLKAKNPEIESQEIIETEGVRGWLQGDLELPALLPGEFDISYNQSVDVENNGAIPAHTILTLYGEPGGITNPYVYNVTTGKIFKVNTSLADETEYIVIDSKLGTVVDQDGNDLSALVDSESEYIMLAPGTNVLLYVSDENPLVTWEEPTAQITIQHRDTVI